MYLDSLRVGTAGGTFLSVMVFLNYRDFLEAMILSAVGAVVSFGVSYLMKYLLKKYLND
ncbi:hypothetical protein [Moheibacter sp.]|uniref:hypothetical protein n=1 Tax=Moheibacter sp. TaxID=1965316 RepID=UPI003C753D6D